MISGAELVVVDFVTAEENQVLNVGFSNGQVKKVDLSTLLNNPPPVFAVLTQKNEFKKVSVNPVGGIQWDCGADLSADYLLNA
jgi:Protein of unknown function (DUF2442)